MKDKLTKSDRHIIYIALLWEYEKGKEKHKYGFCYALRQVSWEWHIWDLPELLQKKPKKLHRGFWFPKTGRGIPKRIAILNQCIKETENY